MYKIFPICSVYRVISVWIGIDWKALSHERSQLTCYTAASYSTIFFIVLLFAHMWCIEYSHTNTTRSSVAFNRKNLFVIKDIFTNSDESNRGLKTARCQLKTLMGKYLFPIVGTLLFLTLGSINRSWWKWLYGIETPVLPYVTSYLSAWIFNTLKFVQNLKHFLFKNSCNLDILCWDFHVYLKKLISIKIKRTGALCISCAMLWFNYFASTIGESLGMIRSSARDYRRVKANLAKYATSRPS